ncbi:hypothetical protein T4A_14417 [Trichinella pseudospiralis]|uniref:Uncharacterized protein n=1 Tax=Trichinella pseudospiralis TaxID=6337 RepID=A0A0V1EKZ7_TRIPS|nr:hypothetical protein T4A_14417 [Trichinella pseudospiralis]
MRSNNASRGLVVAYIWRYLEKSVRLSMYYHGQYEIDYQFNPQLLDYLGMKLVVAERNAFQICGSCLQYPWAYPGFFTALHALPESTSKQNDTVSNPE